MFICSSQIFTMLNNFVVHDQELMKEIIKFLEQFGTEQFDEFKTIYAAVYYLFKMNIFEYPRESIIFYVFSSYDIVSKNLDLKNKKNTIDFIYEL